MDNRNRQTEAEENGEALPEPPAYDCPYEPGDAGYDMAEQSGYYGVMYAAEYEWDNVRCTAEAYGEYDPNARPGNRRNTVDGKPKRSLKFHTTWMDAETAGECVEQIGDYNRFDAEKVADALESVPEPLDVVVARESSPAMYVWTVDAPAVFDAFNDMSVKRAVGDVPDWKLPGEVVDGYAEVFVGPDELGGVPHADSFPIRTVGNAREELETGVPTLVRAWWD